MSTNDSSMAEKFICLFAFRRIYWFMLGRDHAIAMLLKTAMTTMCRQGKKSLPCIPFHLSSRIQSSFGPTTGHIKNNGENERTTHDTRHEQ